MNVNLASKITGQFAPVLGGQFTRYIHFNSRSTNNKIEQLNQKIDSMILRLK